MPHGSVPGKVREERQKERIVLIPNTSHAFLPRHVGSDGKTGLRASLCRSAGRGDPSRQKYVHNDICFPAQIVIGEALAALKSGKYDGKDVAIATGKYIGDCRLTHYSAL